MGPYSQSQWSSWAYSNMSDQFSNYSQFSNYPAYLAESMDAYQTHHNRLVQNQQMSRTTESKPRLSKEEVDVLEAEFQKNHKPSSTTKKALAESMRVDNARINNWFQNRRAREKKENNIREYEAKQRLEKERAESANSSQLEKSRQRDLVASSAPFPQPATTKPYTDSSRSPSEESLNGQTRDGSQYSESALRSPQPLSIQQEDTPILKLEQIEVDDNSCALSDQVDDYFAMQDANNNVVGRPFFARFAGPENIQQSVEGYDLDQKVDLSISSSPVGEDSDIASPDGVDIAARRNRRPAPLSITGGRSNSYTGRANDAGRRSDQAACMRRVSSSTSSGRVTKSVVTPRSPFFDRNSVSFLHRRTSPHAAGRHGSAAPPTPDTPVTLQSQEPMGATTLYAVNGKYTPPDVVISDPTLRTPPTTPGFSDGLFNLGLGYGASISEEALVTPGMGMASNSAMLANYMSNSNQFSAQQMAPMYPTQMSQSYFGFVGNDGNSDYSWSSLSPSNAPASSSIQERYLTLNNMDKN